MTVSTVPGSSFPPSRTTVTDSPGVRFGAEIARAIFPSRDRTASAPFSAMQRTMSSPLFAYSFLTLPSTPEEIRLFTLSLLALYRSVSRELILSCSESIAVRTEGMSTLARICPSWTVSPAETQSSSIVTPAGTVRLSSSTLISVPEPDTCVLMLPRVTSAEETSLSFPEN